MKKIILCLGIVALLSGCGEEEEMMMTCTSNNTNNGLTSDIEYLVTYTDDEVRNIKITYDYNLDTQTDGVGTGTDGTTEDDDTAKDDGIVDGLVGDAAQDVIGGIYTTILDISGLRDRHTNQINNNSINGFTSNVERNSDTNYKVVYNIDVTKLNDNDISRFNVDRSYTTLKNNYTNQGLTCK